MIIRRTRCLLCGAELEPDIARGRQLHPDTPDCEVIFTDGFGVAIDDVESASGVTAPIVRPDDGTEIEVQLFPPVDLVLPQLFAEAGHERLGGASSGRGWTSFSIWQRCPHAWYRRYIDQRPPTIYVESPARAVGSLIHAFLALFYTNQMDPAFQNLTPEIMYERLRSIANPELVAEAWRVFQAYTLYYSYDRMTPLAAEYDLRDPRTGESCRYDLITHFGDELPGLLPGTYIMEHKSSGRFDRDTIDGWANDGEILGQVMLWKRLGLDKRFGELRGVIVNILGKQQEPKFHRTIVAPTSWQIGQHEQDLKRWEGLIQLARSADSFPRARNGCIGRWGRCDYYEECISKV